MKVSEYLVVSVLRASGKPLLAGTRAGQAAAQFILTAVEATEGTVILDFSEMELVTASAFRDAVITPMNWLLEMGRPCLLASVNDVTREEAVIAARQADAVLLFLTLEGTQIVGVEALGALDEKLALTLRIVLKLGEADAKAVKDASGEDTVTTAWNNRLVALAKLGLLKERKVGKTKYYSAIMEGMSYGK